MALRTKAKLKQDAESHMREISHVAPHQAETGFFGRCGVQPTGAIPTVAIVIAVILSIYS